MKNLKKIWVVMLTLLVVYSCSDDDTPPQEDAKTIYDIVSAEADLSLFVAAVDKVGMDAELKDLNQTESIDYTVFVPDDTAFTQFLNDNNYADINAVPNNVLESLLRNHLIESEVITSTTLLGQNSGYLTTGAQEASTGNNIYMFFYNDNGVLMLNGEAEVTLANTPASNGMIHRVVRVIGIPSVRTFFMADPALSRFGEAVFIIDESNGDTSYSDGYADFEGNAPYTLLAPNNVAFDELMINLGINSLTDVPPSDLQNILDLHLITGVNALSSDLTDGMVIPTENGNVVANVDGPAISFTNPDSGETVNVVQADIQAGNGVIHILDRVLLPL